MQCAHQQDAVYRTAIVSGIYEEACEADCRCDDDNNGKGRRNSFDNIAVASPHTSQTSAEDSAADKSSYPFT